MEKFKPLLELDDLHSVFEGERGSLYAHHNAGNTTAYREPSDMRGTGQKLQPPSRRTVYVPSDSSEDLMRVFKNKNISTELVPSKNGKELQVLATEPGANYWTSKKYPNGFKAGDVLASAPVSGKPAVGMAPIELFSSNKSPVGDSGRSVHFGSQIMKVLPIIQSLANKVEDRKNAILQHAPIHSGSPQLPRIERLKIFAKGGKIEMPENYRAGGRTSLI